LLACTNRLVTLPVALDVDDVVLGDRVVVPRLVGQVLVVPLHLPVSGSRATADIV